MKYRKQYPILKLLQMLNCFVVIYCNKLNATQRFWVPCKRQIFVSHGSC